MGEINQGLKIKIQLQTFEAILDKSMQILTIPKLPQYLKMLDCP